MEFFGIWRRHPGFVIFNLSTSQNRFYQIFLDSLCRPNHSVKFWLGWIPKIPRKCTVLSLQPFENSILGFRKVEISEFRNIVRASHGRRAGTSDHQDIEWRGTQKCSASKRFAKENSSHAKKETDSLGWFYLFEYHILNMLDVFKESKRLVIFWNLTRNSDSWFACDSELLFSVAIYLSFQEGCCRLEPQIIENLSAFLESVQVRDRFSRHISHSEEKCSATSMEKT